MYIIESLDSYLNDNLTWYEEHDGCLENPKLFRDRREAVRFIKKMNWSREDYYIQRVKPVTRYQKYN